MGSDPTPLTKKWGKRSVRAENNLPGDRRESMTTTTHYTVWTDSGKLYEIRYFSGSYNVTTPSDGHIGESDSLALALALIMADSGSTIDSIR